MATRKNAMFTAVIGETYTHTQTHTHNVKDIIVFGNKQTVKNLYPV